MSDLLTNIPRELIIVGVIAYALGNINPSIIIGKLYHVNIRKEGSGNPGMTNTIRVIGLKAGIAVLIVDVLKAFAAVKIGIHMAGLLGGMVAFACVVIGHCFPVVLGFKGGKGVAASLGAALALNWESALIALLVAAALFILTRRVSVCSMGAAITYPCVIWLFEPDCLYFAIGAAAFLILMHAANIGRIARGEEKELTVGHRDRKGNTDDDEEPVEEDTEEEEEAESAAEPEPVSVTDDPLTEEELDTLSEDQQEIQDIESGESHITAAATRDPGLVQAQTQEAVRPEPEPMDYYAGCEIPDIGPAKRSIAVIGNGSFGTAMANLLVYNGHDVTLYGRNKEAIDLMRRTRMNDHYLPYVILSDRINYTSDLKQAVKGKSIVVFAVPAQKFREVSSSCARWLDDGAIAVNLAKGIEQKTLKTLSEVAAETIPNAAYVALSGPSHAEEIVRNFPAGVVVASRNKAAAEMIQDVFMSEQFRIYTQDDMVGVEIAGAVKNVIAIITGISDGMKLGSNARAALMTRAIHEITRLGVAMGANRETFAGLSGIGDLIVTCSTNLSRNRRCGMLIGLGLEPEDAVSRVGSVVEGYYTAEAVCELAEKYNVDMPICNLTKKLLHSEIAPEKALKMLMSRSKKDELQ
ncbi:MAG: glycerol-3-phosphate 1-O-acyltransferase PlsY [Mogibacterium sp.]|nr:glycerol-3-phosphate 1-O-acyltransferase PlsY [Mogibacterium sp.]